MTRKMLLWLPFVLVTALFAAFFLGLRHPDDHVTADFRDGHPRLLNIFASWCVPCRDEVPMLARLQAAGVEIDGLAVHDSAPDLQAFLAQYGDPYRRIGLDDNGRAQLAFGSAGVPETFVVDGSGKIVYQHIGVVAEDDIPRLLALLGDRR